METPSRRNKKQKRERRIKKRLKKKKKKRKRERNCGPSCLETSIFFRRVLSVKIDWSGECRLSSIYRHIYTYEGLGGGVENLLNFFCWWVLPFLDGSADSQGSLLHKYFHGKEREVKMCLFTNSGVMEHEGSGVLNSKAILIIVQ